MTGATAARVMNGSPGGGKPGKIFMPVRMSMWAWRARFRAAMLAFAGRDLPAGKRRRDWKAKAGAFASCGRTVAALACDACHEIAPKSGTIVATCGMRTCPICARRKAQKLRHKLVEALKKRKRKSGLYFLTFTMRYDPTDPAEVSAAGILARKTELMTAWASVWRQYLKKRGEAACRAIEVGASGMVHLHVLYLGRRPDVNELRARWILLVGDSPMVNVRYCKNPSKAVVELAKYVTKGASPAKASVVGGALGTFMDPELAVRVEIAFSGDRTVQCYGKWLGISVDEDDDPDEEKEARELHRAACEHCGVVGEWHAANYEIDEWFARFGDQLGAWKPRISGQGPTKPRDEENGQNGSAIERERDEARRIISIDPRDSFVRRFGPSWATTTPSMGEGEK